MKVEGESWNFNLITKTITTKIDENISNEASQTVSNYAPMTFMWQQITYSL